MRYASTLNYRKFSIQPCRNYSPDWAIAFNKGTVKHIFFVAEVKGYNGFIKSKAY